MESSHSRSEAESSTISSQLLHSYPYIYTDTDNDIEVTSCQGHLDDLKGHRAKTSEDEGSQPLNASPNYTVWPQALFQEADNNPLHDISSLRLQNSDSDRDDYCDCAVNGTDAGSGNAAHSDSNKALEDSEEDLDRAISKGDLKTVESIGLKIALLARMGDLAGIKRISSWNARGSHEQPTQEAPSSSSTADTYIAAPNTPVSPMLKPGDFDGRPRDAKITFSPYITSVKTGSQGMSAERIPAALGGACSATAVDTKEVQAALRLLAIVEPMMEAAGRRTAGGVGLSPALKCSDLTGLRTGILAVSAAAARMTAAEPRLLELGSPCHVLGDIHGNLADLDFFRRILWPAGPAAAAGDFLFLGDFVDRGLESLPVVAYIMAMKVLHGGKWWGIRGNHETREVNGNQAHYRDGSFLTQCLATFGEADGGAVWEAVNCYFDALPLAAVVDGGVFCVHGGLPRELCEPWGSLDLIRQVESPLRNASEHKMVYDMLWSDPSTPEQEGTSELDREGFGLSPRGCRSFGERSVEAFLQKYGFQHVFRGHEAQKSGVGVSMGSRLTTIFSTSKDHFPSDVQATCGCVLVDKGVIHPVVRAIVADGAAAPVPASYYLAPTHSNQSVEATETSVAHLFASPVRRGSATYVHIHDPTAAAAAAAAQHHHHHHHMQQLQQQQQRHSFPQYGHPAAAAAAAAATGGGGQGAPGTPVRHSWVCYPGGAVGAPPPGMQYVGMPGMW